DEISNIGKTTIAELKDGQVRTYSIMPEDLGIRQVSPNDIAGGMPEENARDLVQVLKGTYGPKRDIIVMNSAAGIFVGGGVRGLREGVQKAEKAIDSGAALNKLRELVESTGEIKRLERFL
ncbi:MAG: anthranilate phosphoribosyltransferase, partial [Methanocellales archaeon]|nr:anthranilate phosphoribosyltransferase [Methanocellales archaeon]